MEGLSGLRKLAEDGANVTEYTDKTFLPQIFFDGEDFLFHWFLRGTGETFCRIDLGRRPVEMLV
jgi:hypothetical protein